MIIEFKIGKAEDNHPNLILHVARVTQHKPRYYKIYLKDDENDINRFHQSGLRYTSHARDKDKKDGYYIKISWLAFADQLINIH